MAGPGLADRLCPWSAADFETAIDALATLGYPYWLARAQLDLAAWLIDRGRGEEAAPVLGEATAALEALGAAPALARAQALGVALAGVIAR